MLLLAVLVGHPDVGDFREALPAVQIELEEHLHERAPLPGRALVQRLLGERSRHLHVFHTYAHRLACYGVAQPLAEELLGVALRATVRGDTRVFYLPDRGGDAGAAMTRLRADLDAVRAALRHTLTAAQAAAVRESRVAVLDRLRGRLHGEPPGGPVRPLSDSTGRLLYPALDLGAAGGEHCERELAYLSPLAGQPSSVLGRWERELSGPAAGGAAAGRARDFLPRYCRRLDLDAPAAVEFLRSFQELTAKVARAGPSADPAQAEDRERVLRWLDEHRALAERLACGADFVGQFRAFLAALGDKLLTPWDRALRARRFLVVRRKAARVPLNRAERAAIPDAATAAALDRLAGAVRDGEAARARRAADFKDALLAWRTWRTGRSWLDAVARLEADALRQREEAEAASDSWDRDWSGAEDRLRECLARVRAILRTYDAQLAAGTAPQEVTVRLTRAQRQALGLDITEEVVGWLHQDWPAPGDRVEAVFALWELGSDAGPP
jgi:hypothetical protein